MELCTVAPGFNQHGGVPYVARNIVVELTRRGIDCTVVTDPSQDADVSPQLPDSVETYTVPKPGLPFPLDVGAFAARATPVVETLHRRHNFDVVHVHGNYVVLPIVAKQLGVLDAPVIETAHGTYVNEIRSFREYPSFSQKWKYCTGVYLDHLIQKYGSRFVDFIHTVAERSKPELESMGLDGDDIVVVPNGVNLGEFDDETVSGDLRSRYGLEDADLAVSVGNTVPRKGVHTLIEAAEYIRDRNPDAHLVHVGGHSHEGYAAYLHERMAELGVEDTVTLTGRVPREELLGWLETCNVAVSASYSEGCPISILEAGASSCTVVATDVGGSRDVLGELGIYVEPADPQSVADGILTGFERDSGAEIRYRIEEQFTWDRIVDDIHEKFQIWLE